MDTNYLQQNECQFCGGQIKEKSKSILLIITHNKDRYCSHKCKKHHNEPEPSDVLGLIYRPAQSAGSYAN